MQSLASKDTLDSVIGDVLHCLEHETPAAELRRRLRRLQRRLHGTVRQDHLVQLLTQLRLTGLEPSTKDLMAGVIDTASHLWTGSLFSSCAMRALLANIIEPESHPSALDAWLRIALMTWNATMDESREDFEDLPYWHGLLQSLVPTAHTTLDRPWEASELDQFEVQVSTNWRALTAVVMEHVLSLDETSLPSVAGLPEYMEAVAEYAMDAIDGAALTQLGVEDALRQVRIAMHTLSSAKLGRLWSATARGLVGVELAPEEAELYSRLLLDLAQACPVQDTDTWSLTVLQTMRHPELLLESTLLDTISDRHVLGVAALACSSAALQTRLIDKVLAPPPDPSDPWDEFLRRQLGN